MSLTNGLRSNAMKLHLITQDNQPYMSVRKCCEKCGLGLGGFTSSDYYCTEKDEYTKKNAKDNGLKLCSDW